ncbi:MAG: hypothetical protein Q7U86_04385, partial [Draconibacterium sp.]|nr:hypothetical protein [Draconibacterium sp.]
MKTIKLLVLMLFASFSFAQAQNLPIDFETGTFNITNFDGGTMTVIDNPQSSGINTSKKVARMIKNAGELWAGSYITLDNSIDFSTKKIFKMKVYSPKAGTKVLLKVENPSDNTIFYEKEMTTTIASKWEELQFDYAKIDATKSYRNIVIIFDRGTMGDGSSNFTYLLDDILLEEGTVIPADAPTTAAPAPPAYDASKVISIFSESFADLDGTNFNPYWQQTTVGSIENYGGNKLFKLLNLNYQGIELASEVNAASMKYLHVDVWTTNETKLDIYPISRTTGEKKASLTPLKLNQWNSFNIKLSDITTQGFNLADLFQFKIVGAGGHTVYIDNLYLYDDNAAPDTEAPSNFTATLSTVTYNSIKLLLKANDNSGAVNFYITVGANTTKIGAASGVQKSYEFTRLPSSTEFTFSITAKDPAENSASNNPIRIVTTTNPAPPAPVVSSPTPPSRLAENVISIFSDAYTNVANTNFNPWWQQSSWFSSEQVGGNEVVKYENFNYQGIEIGSTVNASAMQFLHIDLWTPNETSLSISPISKTTGEKAFKLTPVKLNGWNSYDIPLSSFTIQGLSMADIIHLKFVGSGKSIIYLDNIYFYKGP